MREVVGRGPSKDGGRGVGRSGERASQGNLCGRVGASSADSVCRAVNLDDIAPHDVGSEVGGRR